MSNSHPMKRQTLRNIIAQSAAEAYCEPDVIQRLVDTADDADIVLVGQFEGEVDGKVCGCPATLAGYFDSDTGNFVDGTPPQIDDFTRLFDEYFILAHQRDWIVSYLDDPVGERPMTEAVPDPNHDAVKYGFDAMIDFVRIED